MQHRLALKHLSGSRANTVDRIAVPSGREIVFGRDPGCHVRYDERDELVSRKHMKIVATDDSLVRYTVVDLGSRNGTFVNRQRVFGAVPLPPASRVQLGPGGPEFEFGLHAKEAKPKRQFARGALAVFLFAAACTAGYVAWPSTWTMVEPLWRDWLSRQAARAKKGRLAGPAALASIATVEAEWRLFDKQSGISLSRAFVANERISQGARVPLVEGAPARLPAFVLGDDRRIEPLLVQAGTAYSGQSVGGKWTSNGVVVTDAGSVLTAAPPQRPWKTGYQWNAGESAGALLVLESLKIIRVVPLAAAQFPRWVPAQSGFVAEQLPAELAGDVRGRRVSEADLIARVSANIENSGRILQATFAAESSGIWLAAAETGNAIGDVRLPPLNDGATRPQSSQPVWVVGDGVEKGAILDAPEDGLLSVRAPRCREGGVVFDQGGRVLALCLPDAGSRTTAGAAVPIHRGLDLLKGATDGKPRQP